MVGYYILSGILIIFFIGIICITCDMVFNQEEKEIVYVKTVYKPIDVTGFISDED